MDKPDTKKPINRIFLTLQSNGYLVLDKEYLWDGCDTPELDSSIEMTPASIRKLVELCCSRNLSWIESDTADQLKALLTELKDSSEIIINAIKQIEAKT